MREITFHAQKPSAPPHPDHRGHHLPHRGHSEVCLRGGVGLWPFRAHRAAHASPACAVRSGSEIAAGAALILNAYAGAAAVLLLCVIVTAIITTKIPILLGHGFGPFSIPKNTAHTGFLGFIHEARTDLAMLISLIAILLDSGVNVSRSAFRQNR
jgi:hypothetical protein